MVYSGAETMWVITRSPEFIKEITIVGNTTVWSVNENIRIT